MAEKISKKIIVGSWKNSIDNETKSNIKFSSYNSYYYEDNSEISAIFFSNGKWNIKNDTLYLNSIMPSECLYAFKFGPDCRNSDMIVEEKIETTIENCMPNESQKYFIRFSNEKFILRSDTLFHIPKCQSTEKIKFHK